MPKACARLWLLYLPAKPHGSGHQQDGRRQQKRLEENRADPTISFHFPPFFFFKEEEVDGMLSLVRQHPTRESGFAAFFSPVLLISIERFHPARPAAGISPEPNFVVA